MGPYGNRAIDMDPELRETMYTRDLVHLDREGEKRLGKRMLEWVLATEKLQRRREEMMGKAQASEAV